MGLKDPKGCCRVGFLGILHCVQDDSRNLQRQMQMQIQEQMRGFFRCVQDDRQELATANANTRANAGFFAALRMTRRRGGGGGRELQRREI
jgi:hypothetical protein